MEIKLNLKSDTIDALQDLIEKNINSAEVQRQAADSIDRESTARLFQHVAAARASHAAELQGYVSVNDEEPVGDGSLTGSARRAWIGLRAAINGGDPKVVLIEAERAEDVIKAAYEKLLHETVGSAMNDVLMRHYREVKMHHDLIRDLRDAEQAA